ncbi:hypothetical protein FACS189487_05040 [Campylobacterota bacterium]|nr:hypothetical protein FACS189487_05040 [Campylobacterota bacterium]
MDRIERLERWWLIYKAKQILKRIAFFAIAVSVGAIAVYYASNVSGLNTKDAVPEISVVVENRARNANEIAVSSPEIVVAPPQIRPVAPESIAPVAPIAANTPAQPAAPIAPSAASKKPKMSIAPSFGFENDLNRRVEKTAAALLNTRTPNAQTPSVPNTPTTAEQTTQTTQTTQPAQIVQATPTTRSPQNTSVLINRIDSLAELEKAFNRQPNYSKAVDIAREHLKKGNSQAAYDWSMRANELNDRDERSWAIFAVSSYRLGNKERALLALRAYLSEHTSEKLLKILRQIEADEPNAGGDI